jgi:tRNA-modifying protein YgfZ
VEKSDGAKRRQGCTSVKQNFEYFLAEISNLREISYLPHMAEFVSDVHYFSYRPAAVLKILGEDALTFLQGQFTQELKSPLNQLCAYGLWLNQKGKVLGDSFALKDGAEWWLVSPSTPAAVLRDRLEAYIIADDVNISDESADWRGAVLLGADAAARFQQEGVTLPQPGAWARLPGGMLFRGRRDQGESWEWLHRSEGDSGVDLRRFGTEIGVLDFQRRRIRAGRPEIPTEFGPGDLPNEAGLEADAISFTKGCYLGQEVMARLKSMGQVRRRLVVVEGAGPVVAVPAALHAKGKRVGELRVAVADSAPDSFVGLAMISLLGLDPTAPLSLQSDGVGEVKIVGNVS